VALARLDGKLESVPDSNANDDLRPFLEMVLPPQTIAGRSLNFASTNSTHCDAGHSAARRSHLKFKRGTSDIVAFRVWLVPS